MNEILSSILSNGWSASAAVAIIGVIINFILKTFVTEENLSKWGDKIKSWFVYVGIAFTAGMVKIPGFKVLWNNTIEPIVIIFLRLLLLNMLSGLIEGMQSDNKSTKE